jgi:polyhydroxyalkanoate synthase
METPQHPLELAVTHLVVVDTARRRRGAWFERLGFKPQRTPSRVLWTGPRARLLAYDDGADPGASVLVLPAPIKRAYIWDLAPQVSVVRRCLNAGLRVYLLEWTDPSEADARLGLDAHIERVIAPALAEVLAETCGCPPVLAGHSLGGTLAAITAALHPERVAALVLIETPLRFGLETGALGPLVAATPAATMAALARRCVPGSFLSLSAMSAVPGAFVAEPWFDWLVSSGNAAAADHLRVRRWTSDEMAMPGALFVDIVEGLYRDDRFARRALRVNGRRANPRLLAEIPTLVVVQSHSRVVPPASALDLFANMPMRDLHVLDYDREIGVALQHVGALVGRSAHRRLWPKILAWIEAHRPAGPIAGLPCG